MNRPQEIEAFLLLAHGATLRRLRDDPRLIDEALERVRRLSAKAGALAGRVGARRLRAPRPR